MPEAIGGECQEGKSLLGHPRGLFVLFFVEMWERFSFYGMRALLIFYLLQHWQFAEERAYTIYGAYTALVYVTPAIGGYLADRYLGARHAVLYGAVLLTAGHGLMALEGSGGQNSPYLNAFWAALALIIVGSGFLKANISVLVGKLYGRQDPRRDPAFTIFYMGINVGAALGPIVAGYLGQTYGWQYGFGAAGIGMLLGLLVFAWGAPLLIDQSDGDGRQAEENVPQAHKGLCYAGGLALVGLVWLLLQHQQLVGWTLGAAGALVVGYILATAVLRLGRAERNQIFLALFLILLSILFWAFFEQAGSSLNVYTQQHVDRRLFGIQVPAAVFQSLVAIYIVVFGPVFAALWLWLARRGREPSAVAKFGLALVALGAGFLILVAGAGSTADARTPVLFIFLLYLMHTMGELCLSPVGLSAMTRLAAPQMVGLLMGTWFLASATGNFAAGLIARATGAAGGAAGVIDVYGNVGWTAVAVGGGIILLAPFLSRHLDQPRRPALADA